MIEYLYPSVYSLSPSSASCHAGIWLVLAASLPLVFYLALAENYDPSYVSLEILIGSILSRLLMSTIEQTLN